ncbi:MAG: hypothetical protein BM563_07740 [Bacteroidetes bacterium MedPE-SWsnd-G1]|nr:MAG: hypothetical protein BM563_07740 [Bacteroidetes bacterium MedPE-SWsnd-G1]
MKNIQYYVSILILSIFIISCSSDDDPPVPPIIETPEVVNLDIQDFIWKGLNLYYLWQQDVPDLADDKFATQSELNTYLEPYAGRPDDLFDDLLHAEDRYSWIVDDYVALDQQLQGGISTTSGMDWRLSYKNSTSDDLIAFVRYVMPDSDAYDKGMKRGDLFQKVNGQQLNINNYQLLLLDAESFTLELTTYNNGTFNDTGELISLTKEEFSENPIHLVKTIDDDGKKIGYIMYNQFLNISDVELNDAFGQLKSEGIEDLVLDLRYNGGGHSTSAKALASMITGQFEGDVFFSRRYNDKLNAYFIEEYGLNYLKNYFSNTLESGEAINSLNLDRVVILSSSSTASSSELIINGLSPYIDVTLIGETTSGKTWGSITMYDSPNFSKEEINPNHTWAMQPLIVESVNSVGFNNKTGFIPDYELPERVSTLGTLGDPNEPLLAKALEVLNPSTKLGPSKWNEDFEDALEYFTDSKKESPMGNIMILEERELPKAIFELELF